MTFQRKVLLVCLAFASAFVFSDQSKAAATTICDNIQGTSTKYINNKISANGDGYRGTTITLLIDTDNRNFTATWAGKNNFTDKMMPVATSPDGWMTFLAPRKSVIRTYTLFVEPGITVLGLTESQTQLMTGAPQIRSYFGTCKEVN